MKFEPLRLKRRFRQLQNLTCLQLNPPPQLQYGECLSVTSAQLSDGGNFVDEAYSHKNIRVSRADLGKDPDEVSAMFDGVAKRYDIINDLLSLGRTKAWRKLATKIIDPKPGMKILDIAAGTGSSSRPLKDAGAEVIPLDFSKGMIEAGKKRNPDLPFTQGDAMNLPFKDNEFDVTTISFGLRNTNNYETALAQALADRHHDLWGWHANSPA